MILHLRLVVSFFETHSKTSVAMKTQTDFFAVEKKRIVIFLFYATETIIQYTKP